VCSAAVRHQTPSASLNAVSAAISALSGAHWPEAVLRQLYEAQPFLQAGEKIGIILKLFSVRARGHVVEAKLLSSLCFIASMALFGVSQASAASITYDLTPITIGSLSLTGGYITTDGTIGPLASTDITAWSVTITGGPPGTVTVTGTLPRSPFPTRPSIP